MIIATRDWITVDHVHRVVIQFFPGLSQQVKQHHHQVLNTLQSTIEATPGLENRVCGHTQRWEDEGVLGDGVGNTLSRARYLITYSSKTIAQNTDSRNLNHFRAFAGLKDLLGERPLVLDQEFSYLELMLNMPAEQINWVIRLNLRAHPPKFYDEDGEEVALTISPSETVIYHHLWYMGKVKVNLIGIWSKGFTNPLWVMTNLEARRGLKIYFARVNFLQHHSFQPVCADHWERGLSRGRTTGSRKVNKNRVTSRKFFGAVSI